jgi:hypothetical protein
MPIAHGGAIAIAIMLWHGISCAQALSPYSVFQGLTQDELGSVQVKLSPMGNWLGKEYVLAFTTSTSTLDLSVFRAFYRPQFLQDYGLDSGRPASFVASPQELGAMIDSVGTIASITDGGVDSPPSLSFAMSVVKDDTVKVFESILDTTDSRLLFGRLLGALGGNPAGTQALALYACSRGVLPGPSAMDVTSRVAVVARGFRKDRAHGQYAGKVRLTNTSGEAIPAPMVLAFDPGENITLVASSGQTCAVWPYGVPYIEIPVGAALAPGAHVDVVLRFDNPDDSPIDFSVYRLYAGPGFH